MGKNHHTSKGDCRARDMARSQAHDRKRATDSFLVPDEEYVLAEVSVSSPSPFSEYKSNITSQSRAEEEKARRIAEQSKSTRIAKTGSDVPVSTASAKSLENQKVEEFSLPVANTFSVLSKAQARKARKAV